MSSTAIFGFRPTRWLVGLFLALAALGALVVAELLPMDFWWVALAVSLVVAIFDLINMRQLANPTLERSIPKVIPLGVERLVSLRFRQHGKRTLRLLAHDLHPEQWQARGLPRSMTLAPKRELECSYTITPNERGEFDFIGCDILLESPFKFWHQRRHIAAPQMVRVYPNFAPLAKLALVGAEQASRVVGAHVKRRRGEGTEFQQLREYRDGDSMRQIDWKASQRVRKLISRDYQIERNQQIILMLDTGRRMLARDGQLSHFDHTLNAALLVAHMALRQGDAVGLLALSDSTRYVAPKRGLDTIDQLLNNTFDLYAKPVASDYLRMVTELAARQRKRSLILIVTNARDEDINDLLVAVRQLRRKHVVCVASLREEVLQKTLEQAPRHFDDALLQSSVAQFMDYRKRAHEALRAEGVDVLDVNCRDLPAALVEHYLAIKRSGRL